LGCSEGIGIRHFGNSLSGFSAAGSGRIWMSNVYCSGSEVSLTECYHAGWGNHNCDHMDDVGVCCKGFSVEKGSCHSATTDSSCLPRCLNNSAADGCQCQPGFDGPTGGLCTACVAGKYKDVAGSALCQSCPSGKVSDVVGATTLDTCLDCVAGKYIETEGASGCEDCGRGKFSEIVGATTINTCLDCVAGKYSDIVNATSMDSCLDCVAGKYSDIVGATTIDTCVYCSAGKHMELETKGAAGPCSPCPVGFSCAGGGHAKFECSTALSMGWRYCPDAEDGGCDSDSSDYHDHFQELQVYALNNISKSLSNMPEAQMKQVHALGDISKGLSKAQAKQMQALGNISESLASLAISLLNLASNNSQTHKCAEKVNDWDHTSSPTWVPSASDVPHWNQTQYKRCQPVFASWQEMQHQVKAGSVKVKTGGLGRLLIPYEYESWICVHDDACSLGGDWYFCYVFKESIEKFVPWDQHYNLKLFKPRQMV